MESHVKTLNDVVIFSSLSKEDLEILKIPFQRKTLPPKTRIITQGETGEELYIILKGNVNISRSGAEGSEVFISAIGPGEYFGEAALFSDVQRSAHVTTDEECEIMVIARTNFVEFLSSHSAVAAKILYSMIKVMFERLEKVNHELQFERKDAVSQSAIDAMFA